MKELIILGVTGSIGKQVLETIKGKIISVGEILGYSMNIDEIN